MALVRVVDDILCNIDSGSVVALIGLVIYTAFNIVNYDTLLRRLQSEIGVSGRPLRWISSYFTDRSFLVHVGTSSSAAAFGCVAGIGQLIEGYGVGCHKYTNDTRLYASFSVPVTPVLARPEALPSSLQWWFWQTTCY